MAQQKAEGTHSQRVWEMMAIQGQDLPFFGSGWPPPGRAGRARRAQAPAAAPKANTKIFCLTQLLWQSSAATRGELSRAFTGNKLTAANRQWTGQHKASQWHSGGLAVLCQVPKEKEQILVQLIDRKRAKQPRKRITHLLFLRAAG